MNDGTSFTGFTVSMNVLLSLPPPLLFTVTVMFVVPERLATGLIVITPVVPANVALRLTGTFGTNVGLLELAVTDVTVPGSPGSKGTTNCVSSFVVVSGRFASVSCVS